MQRYRYIKAGLLLTLLSSYRLQACAYQYSCKADKKQSRKDLDTPCEPLAIHLQHTMHFQDYPEHLSRALNLSSLSESFGSCEEVRVWHLLVGLELVAAQDIQHVHGRLHPGQQLPHLLRRRQRKRELRHLRAA